MQKSNQRGRLLRRAVLASALLLSPLAIADSDNLLFSGSLVAEPCIIPPGEEQIPLDFGTIIDKYLYSHQRSTSRNFSLHLAQCDLTIGKTVRIGFSGAPNSSLPGMLALDAASVASGIAIGLETRDGKPLAINQAGEKMALTEGENRPSFRAFVQGEPQALAGKTIQRGPFIATLTFSLDYE